MSMLTLSLKNLFRRPFTVRYPRERSPMPVLNRGRVMWDMDRCIFCRRCERGCPTEAIVTDKEHKTQTVFRHRCITCRVCVEVCPTQTITMVEDYSRPDTSPVAHVFKAGEPKWEYQVLYLPRYDGKKELASGPDGSKPL